MNVHYNVALSSFSTFLMGGNTDSYIEISSKEDLNEAFEYIKYNNLRYLYLGGGSNILFSDKEIAWKG